MTIRLKLLKIGARLRITVRNVWLSFSQVYPYASDFAQILANVRRYPAVSPPVHSPPAVDPDQNPPKNTASLP
jgi:hypothetical protein